MSRRTSQPSILNKLEQEEGVANVIRRRAPVCGAGLCARPAHLRGLRDPLCVVCVVCAYYVCVFMCMCAESPRTHADSTVVRRASTRPLITGSPTCYRRLLPDGHLCGSPHCDCGCCCRRHGLPLARGWAHWNCRWCCTDLKVVRRWRGTVRVHRAAGVQQRACAGVIAPACASPVPVEGS